VTLAIPLVFAARLLSVLVAVSAALVLFREEGRGALTRALAGLGFLAVAAAEAWLGFSIGAEVPAAGSIIRASGYALLLLSAVVPAREPAPAVPAVAALPGRPALPGALAAAAGLAMGIRRRGEPGGLALAVGLVLLGVADTLPQLREEVTWAGLAAPLVRVAAYLFVVRFVVVVTRRRIRFRILAGFFVLLLAVIVAVSSVVAQVISDNLRESARDRVSGQAETVQREFLRRAQDAALRVAAIAGPPSTARAFAAGQDLDDQARGLLSVFVDVDFVVFLDDRLRIRGEAGTGSVEALAVAGSEVSRSAAEGVEAASLEGLGQGGMAVLGANPLQLDDEVVGVVVAGFRVDRGLLERTVPSGTPVAVYRRAREVPSTAAFFPGWRRGDELVPAGALARIRERTVSLDRPIVERISAGGEQYFAAFAPLRSQLGVPVGTLVVAEPAGVLAATQRGVTRVLFLVALASAALALFLAVVAARRITEPVVALTGAARRVQAGDLRAKAEVRGEDEVADLAGAFNLMTDSVHDMTGELREAAEEQARLRGRLETVLNSMGDGLVAVDRDGIVVTCNPTASEILGVPRRNALGRPVGEVIRGRDAEGGDLLAGGAMRPGLGFVERSDGRSVPVAISSAPLRDGRGEEVGAVYVLRDMTREREVERMKGEFLANVSHELRTPLTPIIGYSELISKRPMSEEKAREFAAGILDSARRLERIVAMLVDFSAMEGGRMPLTLSEVELPELVEGTLGEWRGRTDRHRFDTDFEPGLPPAHADLSLLRKVLDELLDNAVKYSPEGGRVEVGLIGENNRSKRMIRVEIADEGIGIEPENMAHIFQDFRQVDASDTRAFGGLGLGLAFVKRIVEAHGGRIAVESEPGGGAVFRFTVPAADTPDGAA
jgi:two-component system, OmpR family, phosphate regulon sensor histidine kinase PhoR